MADPSMEKETDPKVKEARVVLKCLLLGKSGQVLPLRWKGTGLPLGGSYPLSCFDSPALVSELRDVRSALEVSHDGNSIYRLPNVAYVHVYKHTIACSSFTLSKAQAFFTFVDGGGLDLLPQSSIDIKPFLYGGQDLLLAGESSSAEEYSWVTEPRVAWDWGEAVWAARLVQCLEISGVTDAIRVIPAYKWTPSGYISEINSLFPNVMSVKATPFHGMTDILLMGPKSVGVVHASAERCLCSVELGINKQPTTPVTIGNKVKMWPEKVGELLASMYMFGTLNYLNHLSGIPECISWTTFGVLALRSIGCLVLRMEMELSGCSVHLVYEGGAIALGSAVEFVVKCINGTN